MSVEQRRTAVLIAVLMVIALVVAIDRGLLAGGDTTGPNASQRYALLESQLAMQNDLLDADEQIRTRRERAAAVWRELEPRLVTAPTPEVAPAALRERLSEELRRQGISAVRVLGEEVRGSEEGAGAESRRVVPIRVRLSFDAEDSAALYRALASLDGTDRLHARVVEFTLRGGGLNPQAQTVTATVSVDTAVLLGGAP